MSEGERERERKTEKARERGFVNERGRNTQKVVEIIAKML